MFNPANFTVVIMHCVCPPNDLNKRYKLCAILNRDDIIHLHIILE